MVGPLWKTCSPLAVPLYPTGGFPSLTLTYEAAESIKNQVDVFGYSKIVILYVGDYDPSGLTIDVDLEKKMRDFLGDDINLEFNRIAITKEQIEEYDLPTKPRKENQNLKPEIKITVETEALDASILRGLLHSEIERHIPENAVRVLRATEKSEKASLVNMAKNGWKWT